MQKQENNDFIVKWQGNEEETTKVIIQRLFNKDLMDGLPLLIMITGRSGSGKSCTAIKIQDWLYNEKKLNYLDYFKENIVLSPLDYSKQIKKILRDEKLKKIFTIQIDEGRFVVGAENWGTFINAAIGHVNASARAIKTMATFIVTQSLRDVDKRLRDAVNIQVICRKVNGKVSVTFRKFWIDDSDVENPRLRYKIPTGTIKFDDGTKQRIRIKWMPKKLGKEYLEPYEKLMKSIKGSIIDEQMDKLIVKIAKQLGETRMGVSEKVAQALFENPLMRQVFGKIKNSKWVPSENAKVLGLNDSEMKEMKKSLSKKLKEGGYNGGFNKSNE